MENDAEEFIHSIHTHTFLKLMNNKTFLELLKDEYIKQEERDALSKRSQVFSEKQKEKKV